MAELCQNCKYQMPRLNTRYTVHTRTAIEDVSFCTWPCSVFAISGHTDENGSTMSVDGVRLQTYGFVQGTDIILIINAEMHYFSNLFW